MADIVVSSKKKVNLFDRVIQSVVIMVNMNKMNRAIDEHLNVIHKTETEDKRLYEENILREIVFVKYQYDIMQRQMYELKISYASDIVDKINSTEKTDRYELQKVFLEMEYDRITKSKFKLREDVKFNLLSISSAIDAVKQNIKDEGKAQRYNKVIKVSEDLDTKIQTEEYTDEDYQELFNCVDEYVDYINDNYDISKLPSDERELIEFVIETMINGIESDIDKHLYEYNLIINICKNSYRYFKIIDKIFEKLQNIYDESLEKDIIALQDYAKMYKDIYDLKIKTMVNDVHRSIKTEDEYLEYSKLAAGDDEDTLRNFVLQRALELTKSDIVKEKIKSEVGTDDEEMIEENIIEKLEDLDIKEDKKETTIDKVRIGITKTIRKVGRPKKKIEVTEVKEKRGRGRPSKKEKVVEAE
ncbi:MAG: hypothetical protein PHP54_02595 [Clostridia bacterium]|nr:hypothetical protein [Clostridia bacterium]